MRPKEGEREELDRLRGEVARLRGRVAELERRGACREDDTTGVSVAEREEVLCQAEGAIDYGTWTWDGCSGRVTWSDGLFRILGLDPATVSPSVDALLAAVHPADVELARRVVGRGPHEAVLPLVDCRVVRPDGAIRRTLHFGSRLFDAGGTPHRAIGGVIDRTERLEEAAELRRTSNLLEEAQRLAKLGSWRFVPHTGQLEWSRELRRIAGVGAEVRPSPELLVSLLVEEDRERFGERLQYVMTPLGCLERNCIDGRLRRPDGKVRHVRLERYSVLRSDGYFELRGTMMDVTDQVQLREKLAHAQKMEAVGRLAGGIAHDFNNLLTIMTANLELLRERIGSTEELLESLHALGSASSLTRRLLAFGSRAQLSLRAHDPNALVDSTMSLMRRLVGDEVRLETSLTEALPRVLVDALEIERALVNLVVNARDVTPRGGAIRISTSQCLREGTPHVGFSVADEGPGIEEAERRRIFEPFYTTRAQSGGTGLGLATVLGMAEQHGGQVCVEASPTGGSVFTVLVPAIEASPPEVAATRDPEAAPETRPLRVLVIDDEPTVARATQRILQARGHSVQVANRPDVVLDFWAASGSGFDLVVCDVVMTTMRGPELIQRLAERGAKPRVLFVTGCGELGAPAELGHPALAKPFTTARLLSAVQAAMA